MKKVTLFGLMLGLLFAVNTSCDDNPPPADPNNCGEDYGLIPITQARKEINDFLSVRETIIAGGLNYQDSEGRRVGWRQSSTVTFDLRQLKCFIEYTESFNRTYTDLGIRAYIAARPVGSDDLTATVIFAPVGTRNTTGSVLKAGNDSSIMGDQFLNLGTIGTPPNVVNP